MAAFAIYLGLGTWFLLNLIASSSGLKSRVASKQGQHQFDLITLHCSLLSRDVATGVSLRAPDSGQAQRPGQGPGEVSPQGRMQERGLGSEPLSR